LNRSPRHMAATFNNSRMGFLFIILIVSFLYTFYPILNHLVTKWYTADEYSHGFLIVPIAAYIIFTKRFELRDIDLNPSIAGIALTVVSLIAYLFALMAGILTLSGVAMIFAIYGVVLYLLGTSFFAAIFFPLFFLLFMIPVPSQIFSAITIPLQLLVSKISVLAAHVLDIPVYREGNLLFLPDHTLEVVQACSGLRSLISLIVLSTVFAYFTLNSNKLRFVLVILAAPAAIVVNMVRVFFTIVFFHYFNMDLTVGSIHTMFGILIFGLAIIMLFGFQRLVSYFDKSA